MNRNLAINNAFIDGKPYLYFGAKRFKNNDKRANEICDELESQGYFIIFVDKKETVLMYVFKDSTKCGPVPCKTEATNWDKPKFIIKSTCKGKFDITIYKLH